MFGIVRTKKPSGHDLHFVEPVLNFDCGLSKKVMITGTEIQELAGLLVPRPS
jgi:hypothetical protein